MDLAASTVSAAALAAGVYLHPEPEWVTRAVDEFGWHWARLNWQRASAVPGAWFDHTKGDHVVDAFPRWFTLTTLRFAGKPFRLQFWQEIVIRLFVGWKAPTEILDPETQQPTIVHVRLFQELRLWVPRKNGKSEFFAALALYFWYYEGSFRGTGFCFAHDEAQAREVFDKMGDMAANSPVMKKEVRVLNRQLWVQKIKAPFRLMPGKAKGKHGRAPYVTVGDEMHEWPSRELANTLRQGEGAQLQPVRLYASTAGLKTQRVGRELFQESEKMLDGRIDDPTVLVVIFSASEEDDWKDEKVWARVNPSIGLSPTKKFLQGEFAKAVDSPRAEAEFRRYHLNQWIEDFARWIPLPKWDACVPEIEDRTDRDAWKRYPDDMLGRNCVLAFDSTQSFDPAALCWRFTPLNASEHPRFIWQYFMPADTIAARVKAEQVPFDRWRDAGAITEIPGGVFDLDYAVAAVLAGMAKYHVTKIAWDPWNALDFYNRLVKAGVPEPMFVQMRFGAKSLGAATKEFERRVFGGELDHGGNPMTRWMAGHCQVRFDENMNFVPGKKRSEQSIDGIVAAVMNEALAMQDKGPSIYEKPGFFM